MKKIKKSFKKVLHLLKNDDNINLVLFETYKWPLGQAVKTPPFHGGNTGSNPVGVTIFIKAM